jgi:hypothetical protein
VDFNFNGSIVNLGIDIWLPVVIILVEIGVKEEIPG